MSTQCIMINSLVSRAGHAACVRAAQAIRQRLEESIRLIRSSFDAGQSKADSRQREAGKVRKNRHLQTEIILLGKGLKEMDALAERDVTLASKVAFLRQPSSYPERAYRVEAIETHMSWVFLTQDSAWKLKKPVRQDMLDFQTLDARRFYCEEEVRLNRRLAPDVYLGTMALVLDAAGHLQLGGQGTVADWLVRMRRLPVDRMLDHAIEHATVTAADFARIAARLAAFYRDAATADLGAAAYRARFMRRIESCSAELAAPRFGLPAELVEAIVASQRNFLRAKAGLFDERVASGKIVEGHGDLRPEHVCLSTPLAIIDCLEFSRELRLLDSADEIGFLALECDRLGAASAGSDFMEQYSRLSGDWPDAGLRDFYQSCRATVRATLAIRHVDEEQFRYSPQWPRRARQYLDLARRHAANLF
jgi:aminoglycoside phosphotransferase family enzyme